ncbi:protein bark beetle [Teleopsis dalmanni]|uniref:protein bark beetle n=1 Tax=Teleopsis dalmanni TaxID=139649 RepID=UPI0018CE5C3F|nr:protein bark beetle [Teleopsis dalmanni]XP_037927280.1 protein bark beetle [Teleopsis dalmanni]
MNNENQIKTEIQILSKGPKDFINIEFTIGNYMKMDTVSNVALTQSTKSTKSTKGKNKHRKFRSLTQRKCIVLVFLYANLFALASEILANEQNRDTNEIEFTNLDGATQLLQAPVLDETTSSTPSLMSYTELKGGEIITNRILRYSESPYTVRENIIVNRGASLTIEPGVSIEFAPTVGITVNGILHAVGTPTLRITLKSQTHLNSNHLNLANVEEKGLRLVDGPTPLEGRLQVYHKGSWRAVCTNSKHWSPADYAVACNQMGFKGGRFWNWVERNAGYEPRLLYEQPKCTGDEKSLLNCAWQTRQLGSGVCDYHSDIGIQCIPVFKDQLGYWRGIYFDNAPSDKVLGKDNTVYTSKSKSTLMYVDIIQAGVGNGYTAKSALESIGQPPNLEHVVVSYSAYTGINATKPSGGFSFQNVTVRQSSGIGIFANSSQGSVHLIGCNIIENAADGIKYVGHDLRVSERTDRASIYDFCTLPTTSGQTYPISLSFNQKYYAGSSKECDKYFFTRPGYLLTVHFEDFVLQTNETLTVQIYDGASTNDRLLFEWKARNYTRPQSVTSTKEKLFIRLVAEMRQEIKGFLRLTSDYTSAFDLRVAHSTVADNGGRGIAIDNIRSKIHVHQSSVSGNGHISGVHITSGAGDVNITQSSISFNKGDGVNITYYGGNRNISRSSISSNKGHGVAVWLNHTTDLNRVEYVPFNQTTSIEYSNINLNSEHGVLHGNYCSPMLVNITANNFNSSFNDDINIMSCWKHSQGLLHLQIGHNSFENSQQNSIFMSPALNVHAKVEFNQFRSGMYGSIYIRNNFIFEEFNFMPVQILIQSNYFMRNKGVYVVSLGLSPFSRREIQSLLFTRNFVKENRITEPFGPLIGGSEGSDGAGRLNPRSKVAAVIVVASGNVDIFRNILHNLDSAYEIGSHISDQSKIINATYNWLGHTNENKIYSRLFHRNDRYNLAKIEYIPYLLHSSNPGSTTIITTSTMVPRFFHEDFGSIGGEVDGQEIIPAGTYTVTKDINIRPGGKLILQPGVTLQFHPSVGMMVAGKLEARGRHPDDILFTLKRETIIPNDNLTSSKEIDQYNDSENLNMDVIDIETESIIPKENEEETTQVPVRILGGAGPYEGRLQIYLNGKWGTVCDYGWTVLNAALVCHQLGYTLNPQDWRLLRADMPNVGTTEDVIVTNVRCTVHDHDITKCRSEQVFRGEFENSCTHENDVGIRCYEGAWAGLRFSMLAERADLQYITIEKAGLFDYTTNSFKPAVQMDFARHNMENVRVINNLNDGLGVLYADIYGGKSINNIKNSEFTGNRGSGISLKQLDFRIQRATIKNNGGSGILHDPVISAVDQNELGGWFKMARDFNTFESNYDPYILSHIEGNIELGAWESKYIRTDELLGTRTNKKTTIRCPAGYVLGIQLLNPISALSTERISILDSQTENTRNQVWELHRDLTVFPTVSSSYGIVIYYESGENALGGAVLMITTVMAPIQNIPNKVVLGPVPSLNVRFTKILSNQRGISAYYYNRYIGDNNEYYLRKANESIKIVDSEISYNTKEAVLIKSPFWDIISSNLSEITIHINSSILTQNGYGIRQLSKDLRSSNNLFHYVMQDTTIENNMNGGFDVALPYVWQYNENFTHSIYLGNCTWQQNRNFLTRVTGHYAIFNITSNTFVKNNCLRSLIATDGMEKRIKFNYNRIEDNRAKIVMEFKADSLSEILGDVPATIEYNTIKGNRIMSMNNNFKMLPIRSRMSKECTQCRLPLAVIHLDGIQTVQLYRNLLADNQMTYNLIAGVRSARLNNFVVATENWWGSSDIKMIESKIFDFDNWNDHADVIFQPFLIEDSFDASVSLISEKMDNRNLDEFIGGRIINDLVLRKRPKPYHILSDITVLPGIILTIQHGVQLEFDPNVGILVLGTLTAIGYKESQIVMKPFKNITHESYTMSGMNRRAIEDMGQMQQYDSIRLCTDILNCTGVLEPTSSINEGFLEYFNHTTLQWVPICDSRFTERNAEVVCRELGFDPLNVYYGHDRRIEFHTNSLTRVWSWVQPLECRGDENRMEDCAERLNGQLYGHRHECHWDDVFVFVSCNKIPDEQLPFWGGIRFANSDFEESQNDHRLHDSHTHSIVQNKESRLEHVRIENAGILHNQKSGAIQSVFKNPVISFVTIVNSAYHGVNIVAPTKTINLNFLNISNAYGTGINMLSLTGEGRESTESSFAPLKELDIPYKLFSMIDICDPQKAHIVEDRVLLYYKYDNKPINCVKLFTAVYRAKPIGFRLLQSNLFNHSKLYGRTDSIRLFDGDIYNVTSRFLGKIESDSSNQRSFFKTSGPTLSVQLMASGAPEYHGFLAEIVTIPISTIGQVRGTQHNITYSHISGTVKGAVSYASAGEITPTLTLTSNVLRNNCKKLYGNFSTCESALNFDVQNMHSLYFKNNLLVGNQGGLRIRADSSGLATSLCGVLEHNLFLKNYNRPALYVEGRQSSPYQEIHLFRNYFAQNRAGYEDVIRLRQVVSNFSYNYVHSNIGSRIVEISGFEKVRLPIYQTTSHNGFYGNVATDFRGRSTIVAGTAGQQYIDNIFENPENDYEMITVNNTILSLDNRNSTIELRHSKIDARYNYWGYNNTISVKSRIRDKFDDPILLEVQAVPFQMNNQTILDGKCPPGWSLVQDTCFIYIAAPMTFREAKEFCRSENSSMPFIRTDSATLWTYLKGQMQHLNYPEKVWVQDFNHIDRCTSFVFGEIEVEDCNRQMGLICEIDPKVVIDPLSWRADVFAISIISAFILAIILLIMVAFCWYAKSKHRHVQRLQRRNSIRQSLRSLNSIDPQGSLRRRNFSTSASTGTLTKNIAQDYKKMLGNGSIDSMDKSVLSSEASFDPFDNQHSEKQNEYHKPQKYNEYVNHNVLKSDGQTSEPYKIATIGSPVKAMSTRGKVIAAGFSYDQQRPDIYELSYRNEGFRDNSTFSGTRNNSISASMTEEAPIIHHIDDTEDAISDYYGNASTLPLRGEANESSSFLSELKQSLPDFRSKPKALPSTHYTQAASSNQPSNSNSLFAYHNDTPSNTLPYDQKIDNFNFSPLSKTNDDDLFRNNISPPTDIRRPDSYYTAVRSSKAQPQLHAHKSALTKIDSPPKRPKTVYQTANEGPSTSSYHRSKSEALLETDFDEPSKLTPLQEASRSYSQPLETAM